MSVKVRALVFVVLVGSALTWNLHLQGQRITTPWQQMSAKKSTHIHRQSAETWQLRGGVRIVQDKAIITADEVDAQVSADGAVDYELRGNVHLTTTVSK